MLFSTKYFNVDTDRCKAVEPIIYYADGVPVTEETYGRYVLDEVSLSLEPHPTKERLVNEVVNYGLAQQVEIEIEPGKIKFKNLGMEIELNDADIADTITDYLVHAHPETFRRYTESPVHDSDAQ